MCTFQLHVSARGEGGKIIVSMRTYLKLEKIPISVLVGVHRQLGGQRRAGDKTLAHGS